VSLSREQAWVVCAAFLFAGMLALAWYDLYAVRMLIAERQAYGDVRGPDAAVRAGRLVPDHDSSGGGSAGVDGHP
jgi:hypothetical protein